GYLGPAQDRRPDGGEPEIERERKLAPAAPRPAFELRDRHLRERPPTFHEYVDELELLGPLAPVAGKRLDEREVGVRDEELGVGAPDDDRAHGVVLGQLTRELPE